jgi:hypothetical protein
MVALASIVHYNYLMVLWPIIYLVVNFPPYEGTEYVCNSHVRYWDANVTDEEQICYGLIYPIYLRLEDIVYPFGHKYTWLATFVYEI